MSLAIQHQRIHLAPPQEAGRTSAWQTLEYQGDFVVKTGWRTPATFGLEHKRFFIALKRHPIGRDETGDMFWSINLASVGLANVDERDLNIRD